MGIKKEIIELLDNIEHRQLHLEKKMTELEGLMSNKITWSLNENI